MYLDILRTGEYEEEINSWNHNADPKKWRRYLFPIPSLGITTSNPVRILLWTFFYTWKHKFFLNVLSDGISLNK